MGTRKVIKGLEEAHTAAPGRTVLAKAPRCPRERGARLTQGQLETCTHTGAELQAHGRQPGCPTTDPLGQGLQAAGLLLLDQWCLDQVRVGLRPRVAGGSAFPGAGKRLQLRLDGPPRRQRTPEAIAAATGATPYDRRRHRDQDQGTLERTRAARGRQPQAARRCEADPHPRTSLGALLGALPVRRCRLGMLAPDEALHLIELSLGDRGTRRHRWWLSTVA